MFKSSCAKAATASCSRKTRTFFSLEMDIHLMRLCVEHNPYQLGKTQWGYILAAMKENFNGDFLVRTLKERAHKLVEKYTQEQLTYKTGTEEQITELGNLLEQVTGYIDDSLVPINEQTDASLSGDEYNNSPATTSGSIPRSVTQRNEKVLADMERDELLNQPPDTAPPGPQNFRRKCNALLPEDELIRKKQELDYELEVKRLKLEEKKMDYDFEIQHKKNEIERERLNLEMEKIRSAEQDRQRQDLQHTNSMQLMQQMHELVMMLMKK